MKSHYAVFQAVVVAFIGFLACNARAAAPASDSASDTIYNSGWANGSNGGSGWGSAWALTATGGGGHFTGNSASNGNGDTNPPFGDINTPPTPAGRAWGTSASGGATRANRSFSGSLAVNQTFHLQMDNGSLPSNGLVGFSLLNLQGDQAWQFSLTGSSSTYDIFGEFGFMNTGIAATDEGLDIAFTLTSPTTYSVSIAVLGAAPTIFTGGLFNEATGLDVSGVSFFNVNGGTDSTQLFYFNGMSISNVPEPSTIALLGLATVAAGFRLRRRSSLPMSGGRN